MAHGEVGVFLLSAFQFFPRPRPYNVSLLYVVFRLIFHKCNFSKWSMAVCLWVSGGEITNKRLDFGFILVQVHLSPDKFFVLKINLFHYAEVQLRIALRLDL